MENTQSYKIGIVGFGPKGFYAFERLIAYIKAYNLFEHIQVHIFNSTGFLASGDVYRQDQPEYLIMNYTNGNISGWALQEPFSVVPKTPDFVSWLGNNNYGSTSPNSYAPRALVGEYLSDCYHQVMEHLPDNVEVIDHIGLVTNVVKNNNEYQLHFKNDGLSQEYVVNCDKVLFATGHNTFRSQRDRSIDNAKKINFIYPTNDTLKHLKKDSLVGIKGFGLTAIDAILALTEGREGTFVKNEKGVLKYEASGKEPFKIYPFSRTGLPMIPRNGSTESSIELHYFTQECMAHLKENKPVSFECTVLPLIKKEFYFAYYSVLFKNYGHQFYYDEDFTVLENQVQYFHEDYPESPIFNWDSIVNPFNDEPILSTVLLQCYLEFLIQEAKKGEDESPFMAAVGAWRKISPLFNELYSFGGLDAASHKLFDTYYFGLFNRLSYGPPVQNMQKMLALCKAGILDFTYIKASTITENTMDDNYTLQLNDAQATELNYIVNATISRAREGEFINELYQNLIKNGLVRAFQNKLNTSYSPGCVDIDENGNAINAHGKVDSHITFYGTPTEGITCDNDTLSRSRNNFATIWAKQTCNTILKKARITENYGREENVL